MVNAGGPTICYTYTQQWPKLVRRLQVRVLMPVIYKISFIVSTEIFGFAVSNHVLDEPTVFCILHFIWPFYQLHFNIGTYTPLINNERLVIWLAVVKKRKQVIEPPFVAFQSEQITSHTSTCKWKPTIAWPTIDVV